MGIRPEGGVMGLFSFCSGLLNKKNNYEETEFSPNSFNSFYSFNTGLYLNIPTLCKNCNTKIITIEEWVKDGIFVKKFDEQKIEFHITCTGCLNSLTVGILGSGIKYYDDKFQMYKILLQKFREENGFYNILSSRRKEMHENIKFIERVLYDIYERRRSVFDGGCIYVSRDIPYANIKEFDFIRNFLKYIGYILLPSVNSSKKDLSIMLQASSSLIYEYKNYHNPYKVEL